MTFNGVIFKEEKSIKYDKTNYSVE